MVVTTRTIKISQSTKDELDKLKLHPRETYNDILNRIIYLIQK